MKKLIISIVIIGGFLALLNYAWVKHDKNECDYWQSLGDKVHSTLLMKQQCDIYNIKLK